MTFSYVFACFIGIILAFLLKRIFFQTITSCQVAGSALTAKNSCCTKSHRLLCLFLRKRDVLVQNTLKTHPYLKNLLCDCARGSSVHPPHNGALPHIDIGGESTVPIKQPFA